MKIAECGRNCSQSVRLILEKSMSWLHSYYALSCIEAGYCRAVIAYEEGNAVGVGVFYGIHELKVGVIYYVAVLHDYRGRGVGKAIIASIEEILESEGIRIFVATTGRGNTASRRILSSMGYTEIEIEMLDGDLAEAITMMTCGYEDDLLYIKSAEGNLLDPLLAMVRGFSINTVERIWREICYNPWRRLRGISR